MSEQPTIALGVNFELAAERRKPRLLALLFCDFTNMTKDDKPNLLGVFDRIYVDAEKRMTPPFAVFARVAEVIDGFDITVFGPDDLPAIQVKSVPGAGFNEEGLPRQIQTALMFRFEVHKEGTFWFDISYKGVSLGGAGLPIQYRKTEDKDGG